MTDEEEPERTTWVPIGIAAVLVGGILAAILLIDGSTDEEPGKAPTSPTSSVTP